MFNRLMPNLYVPTIYSIDIEKLQARGIQAVLTDIDNTLAPDSQSVQTEELLGFYSQLQNAGISVALISNNHAKRVTIFNETTGFPAIFDCKKPSVRKIRALMLRMGILPEHTAIIGDQIFTDILAGNSIGAFTILVNPIKDKTDMFTRFKRLCEKPIIRRYAINHRMQYNKNYRQ